eukprot:4732263-Ditylum_brightwellii.AAC.1
MQFNCTRVPLLDTDVDNPISGGILSHDHAILSSTLILTFVKSTPVSASANETMTFHKTSLKLLLGQFALNLGD